MTAAYANKLLQPKRMQLPETQQDAAAERILQLLEGVEASGPAASEPRPRFGSARGKVLMADDFDAPLEDFKDYM